MTKTSASLLERDAELGQLAALLEAVRGGEGRVALVHGEAGIGKTALLRCFIRDHVTEPVRLFWGGCDALFTPRPLAPLQEVAWAHGGRLAETLRAGASRDTIFETFFDELRRPLPALVVVEDVHWADEATLDLLRFLGRRAERTRALLVITWRDDEVPAAHPLRSVLGDLSREAVRRIPLRALSPAAVGELAASAARRPSNLHAITGGNPFFVTEVLAGPDAAVPATVSDVVLGRASRLSAPARDLLDVASVAPARVELEVLAAAAGPAFDALDELVAAGMLTLSDGAASFRHELARRAVEDAVPSLRARDLHARLLAALRSLPEEPGLLGRLVHHAERAGDVALVARFAPEAARYAARLGAHREAAAHLATALRSGSELEPRRRAELLDAWATECYLTDQREQAIEAGRAALALWGDLGEARREGDLLRRMAAMCSCSGLGPEAQEHGARAVELLEPLPPGPELAMAWSMRCGLTTDAAEAVVWGEKAVALARERGYRVAEAHALNNLGCAHVRRGDDQGWALLEESLRVSQVAGKSEHTARAFTNLATYSMEERRYDAAARWLREGIAFAASEDLDMFRLFLMAWQTRFHVEVGSWSEADEGVALVLDDPLTSGITRMVALTSLALLRGRRGEDGAWPLLDEALVVAGRSNEGEQLVPVALARAELAWLEGDPARAGAEVADALALAESLDRAWYVGPLAVWSWRAGGQPPRTRMARPCELQIAGDWRAAAAELERIGCHHDAMLAVLDGGDPDALLRAVGVLDGLGARAVAARVRRRLSELGVRGVPRPPLAARREHPFDLTRREQEVLEALALGLTNAELSRRLSVAPKTVDHHVSSILGKLGVSSRGRAVAEARRHGLLTDGPAGPQAAPARVPRQRRRSRRRRPGRCHAARR